MDLHSNEATFGLNVDGLYIRHDQEITESFLADCAAMRLDNKAPAREFHAVAAVPTAVADIWMKHGFDIYRASAREIVGMLRRAGLEAFITTPKRV